MTKGKPRKEVDFNAYLDQKLEDPEWAGEFNREYEKIRLAMDITKLREKRGISQAELARRLGTTQSVIARLENPNYAGYTLKTLQNVARALNGHLEISLVEDEIVEDEKDKG